MNRAVLPLLLVLAAILGGVLYFESRSPSAYVGRTDAAPGAGGLPLAPELAFPDQATSWTNVILARPLFSPTRRPQQAAATNVSPARAVLPRLTGVLASAAGVGAIFATPGDKSVVAKPGDRVGPYLIRSISAGEVTVVGPSGVAVLHPTFADNATGQTPAAPLASPPPIPPRAAERSGAPPPLPSQDFIQSVLRQQQEHAK